MHRRKERRLYATRAPCAAYERLEHVTRVPCAAYEGRGHVTRIPRMYSMSLLRENFLF